MRVRVWVVFWCWFRRLCDGFLFVFDNVVWIGGILVYLWIGRV